jgi:tRNA(adenine34) deaminase
MNLKPYDEKYMLRCIELSQQSLDSGDATFGSLITINDTLVAEAGNEYQSSISQHAEIVVLNKAHQHLGKSNLSECTLYTSCEPCPMCSFMIREYKIKRVVFALHSPYMGGFSRWPILADTDLSTLTPFFSTPPEIIGGFLEEEAKKVMDQSPLWMFGRK